MRSMTADSVENILSVDAKFVEYQRQFIHQSDIDVPLRILDHLDGFRHADQRGLVLPRRDDRRIKRIDLFRDLRRRP